MAILKVKEAKIRKKAADTTTPPVEKMRNSAREKNKIPAERIGWRRELGYSLVSIHESFLRAFSDKGDHDSEPIHNY
jgi:hypothetical protein